VTGIDGRYRITGLPPGDLRLNALLPATGGSVERAIKVEAGKTATVDLEIPFDEKKFRAERERKDGGVVDAGARKDAGNAASARPKSTSAPTPSTKP
jgi:hypothetical protein